MVAGFVIMGAAMSNRFIIHERGKMSERQETVDDIIAEKRRRADEIERDCAEKMKRGEMVSDRYARELVADIRREADRLEAAHKRELGNSAALREALKAAELGLFRWLSGSMSRDEHRELVVTIKTALAAPPRNCDIGSAEEQSVRMAEFCRAQYKKTDGVRLCSGCRFFELAGAECQFAWAQLPYEEGGAK